MRRVSLFFPSNECVQAKEALRLANCLIGDSNRFVAPRVPARFANLDEDRLWLGDGEGRFNAPVWRNF